MEPSHLLNQLEVFFGDANSAEARVYARLEVPSGRATSGVFFPSGPEDDSQKKLPSSFSIAGRVTGPVCAYSHTLSATVPLVSKRTRLAPGPQPPSALVAEAVVPDPCFWTAELPFLYQVQVELRQGSQVLAVQERALGIRPLGVRGRRLIFEGRPWVPRGVHLNEVLSSASGYTRAILERSPQAASDQDGACNPTPHIMISWREAAAVMCVESPADELCDAASRAGVLMLAWLPGGLDDVPCELRRLARWPCIAAAVIPADTSINAAARMAARNLLLAQHFAPDTHACPADWPDLVICRDTTADKLVRRTGQCRLPVIAERLAGGCRDLAAARALCDRLQRDLAGQGDFAGYIV